MNELPEWTLPFFDSYTGPNWSDGKWQGSTSRGRALPKSRLDEQSLIHDAYYATATDLDMLDYADELYYKQTRDMSFVPYVIGAMPKFGNAIGRQIARMIGQGYTGSESVQGAKKVKNQSVMAGPPVMPVGSSQVPNAQPGYHYVAGEGGVLRQVPDDTSARKSPLKLSKNAIQQPPVGTKVTTDTPVPQLRLDSLGEYTSDGRFVGVSGQQLYGRGGFMHWEPFSGPLTERLARYRNRRKVYVC